MKISSESISSLNGCIEQVIARYTGLEDEAITDIQFQPVFKTGTLNVYNDEDEMLDSIDIPEFQGLNVKTGIKECELMLRKALEGYRKDLEKMSILRPFSFVLVDLDQETICDLLLIDDDLLIADDDLLKGLDEDLDAFLKHLLEE